ncbi:MAG: major facilitator superfamily 1 protein, partial [Thermoleophilia bacterium]|nr:major facilitator superfamily 1 protein [Thermoleophilia bacterium]
VNDMIPSKQRATVLSFDSLMGSAGGVFVQPALGRSADVYSYATSFVIGGVVQLIALPFLLLSRANGSPADTSERPVAATPQAPAAPAVD